MINCILVLLPQFVPYSILEILLEPSKDETGVIRPFPIMTSLNKSLSFSTLHSSSIDISKQGAQISLLEQGFCPKISGFTIYKKENMWKKDSVDAEFFLWK